MSIKFVRRAIGVFFVGVVAVWAAAQLDLPAEIEAPIGVAGQGLGLRQKLDLAPDFADVAAGESVSIDVLANDAALGHERVLMRVFGSEIGTVRVDAGRAIYSAPIGVKGTTDFHYLAKPRHGGPPRYGKVTVSIGTRVTIRGRVVRSQDIASAVELRLGNRTYSTTTASDGAYRFDFIAFQDADIAVLTARGSEPNSMLHLQSYVGSVGRITQLAGADGVLDRSESNAVTISFLSTAQMVHAVAANGGAPTDDMHYESALLGSYLTSILWMADFLDLVDSGQYPMPPGTDLLAYVSVPGQIVRDWHPDESGGVAVNFSDPALAQDQVVPNAPGAYASKLVLLSDAVESATLDGIREVEIHDPVSSDEHSFVDGYARPASPLRLTVDDEGRATFLPVGDYLLRETTARVSRTATTRQLRYLRNRKLVKLFDGQHADQYFQHDTIALVHPDRPALDRVTTSATTWVGYEQLPVVPYAAEEIAGRAAFGFFCPRSNLLSGFGYCDYQVHAFNASGTGQVEAIGASLDGTGMAVERPTGGSFMWGRRNDGSISVRHDLVTIDYTRITHENEAASGVIAVGKLEVDGVVKQIAHYQQSVRLPMVEPGFISGDLEGTWLAGLFQTAPLDLFEMAIVDFAFSGNRTGAEKYSDSSGYNNVWRFAWSIDSRTVLVKKYPVNLYYDQGQWVVSEGHCVSASGDGQCPVKFQRWILLSSHSDRHYFAEEVYESASFPLLPLVRTAVRPMTLYRQ